MTSSRSMDLAVPPLSLEAEAPMPSNVRQLPLILRPHVVLEMAGRQRERATAKAVARHARSAAGGGGAR